MFRHTNVSSSNISSSYKTELALQKNKISEISYKISIKTNKTFTRFIRLTRQIAS